MATQQTAQLSIQNNTGGTAYIQLFHQNSSNGSQNGAWEAVAAGQTAGQITVDFETGPGSYGIPDYWSVVAAVVDGPNQGVFINSGTPPFFPNLKECQLQSADASQELTFEVDTSTFNVNLKSGACTDTMTKLNGFAGINDAVITNVFVLMLENHSFDNVFGQSSIPGIIHATSDNSNVYNGSTYQVGTPALVTMPTDPGHGFEDILEQLCGATATYPPGGLYPPINNDGFATNYATTTSEGPPPPAADIGQIMMGFDTLSQLPVIYELATQFAVCDQWFSSLPGPTWPNRFFLHGASSAGLDHTPSLAQTTQWETIDGFAYPNGSLFEALLQAGLTYRLYNDNTNAYSDDPQNGSELGAIPQVSSLSGVTLLDIRSLTDFAGDLQEPYPFHYTFIEPNYGDVTSSYKGGSSQHPMDDVYGGEGLIKAVYEAIRSSPVWNTSLLIITYDEHGGFYDSVPPGPAAEPNDNSGSEYNEHGFTFNQYGVRVPAVVVSPWIPQGVVDHTVYDHSSVAKTLEQLFGFPSLTGRDAVANDVLALLTEAQPRTDAPMHLPSPVSSQSVRAKEPTAAALSAEDAEPVNLSGDLPGFLAAAFQTEVVLSGTDEAAKQALAAEYKAISTRGEAKTKIARATAKADAVKARTLAFTGPANVV